MSVEPCWLTVVVLLQALLTNPVTNTRLEVVEVVSFNETHHINPSTHVKFLILTLYYTKMNSGGDDGIMGTVRCGVVWYGMVRS